jgi:lipoprotein-releasing system permease protein
MVAAVNMISALTMMVTDKTRAIAILKSMGATTGAVGRVFQVVGVLIGGAGTVLGLGLGLTVCKLVADYGYYLDPRVYMIDKLPIAMRPHEVALVGLLTLAISFLATLLPARRAARLPPVQGLMYDKN